MSDNNNNSTANTTDNILNNTIKNLFDKVIEQNKKRSESDSCSSCTDEELCNKQKWEIVHKLAQSQEHLCQMFLELMNEE